jgi:hypothetical protein
VQAGRPRLAETKLEVPRAQRRPERRHFDSRWRRSTSYVNLAVEDRRLGFGKRLGSRRPGDRAIPDRVLAAVTVAVNDTVFDGCDRASLVSADLAERLVFPLLGWVIT